MSHFGPTIILEPVDLRSLRSNVANQNLSNPDFSLQSLVQDRLLTVEELLKMRCINFSKLRWIFCPPRWIQTLILSKAARICLGVLRMYSSGICWNTFHHSWSVINVMSGFAPAL